MAAPAEDDFRQKFDVEYAFIDFGSAHIFPPGTPPIASPITSPPDPFSSPEQEDSLGDSEDSEENDKPIDVFAADVYNLGKTLESELTAALEVRSSDPMCHSTS